MYTQLQTLSPNIGVLKKFKQTMSWFIYEKLTGSFSIDDWIIRQNFIISVELCFWHLPFRSVLKQENLSEFVPLSCFQIILITAKSLNMLIPSCSMDLYIAFVKNGHVFCDKGSSLIHDIFSRLDIFLLFSNSDSVYWCSQIFQTDHGLQ